jgi:hypothetical protein
MRKCGFSFQLQTHINFSLQKRCACASLLAVHMDVIAERMTRVMPMSNHRQHPCSYPAQNLCNTLVETPMQRLARFAIHFASSAINDDAGSGNMYISTSQQTSCSDVLPRFDCWCSTSSSSCPWEPLVNPHILQGILHNDPLPLSLASAGAEVRSFMLASALGLRSDSFRGAHEASIIFGNEQLQLRQLCGPRLHLRYGVQRP